MLFKLIHDKDIHELNPGARAIKELTDLTSSQFFFVCLVADTDYDNPLRTLPDKIKREKAARIAGYLGTEADGRPDRNVRNLINGKVDNVEKAINWYREHQFDEDKAALAAINRQITEAREMMEMDKMKMANKDPELAFKLTEKAMKFGAGINALYVVRKDLEQRIKSKEPIQMNITTNTSADLVGVPDTDEEGEEMSTIDRVNAKL